MLSLKIYPTHPFCPLLLIKIYILGYFELSFKCYIAQNYFLLIRGLRMSVTFRVTLSLTQTSTVHKLQNKENEIARFGHFVNSLEPSTTAARSHFFIVALLSPLNEASGCPHPGLLQTCNSFSCCLMSLLEYLLQVHHFTCRRR